MSSGKKPGRPGLSVAQRRRIVKLASGEGKELTIRELAERLDLSESSVVRVLKSEGLYPRKKGRRKSKPARGRSTSAPTLFDVAQESGVSRSTASLAMRGSQKVAKETQDKVRKAAESLGYKRHPYMGALMATVRAGRVRSVDATLAYLYGSTFKPESFRQAYAKEYGPARRFDGAKEMSRHLGYDLQPFDLYEFGDNAGRQRQILHSRGIRGILVDTPAYAPHESGFDFSDFASVSFRDSFPVRLNVVGNDYTYNIQCAFRELYKQGFRRIGYISFLSHALATYDARTAGYLHAQYQLLSFDERLPPLPLDNNPDRLRATYLREQTLEEMYGLGEAGWIAEDWDKIRSDPSLSADTSEGILLASLKHWLERWKPDVIISELNELVDWLNELGYEVPRDISVVHTDLKEDVPGWAGIRRSDHEMGQVAAKVLCEQIDLGQFGLPDFPIQRQVRGEWETGWTLGVTDR